MTLRLLLLGLAAAGLCAACDPSTSASRLGIFAFQRNALVTECCNCLDREVYVDHPAQVCPQVEVEVTGDAAVDGGCPDAGFCVPTSLTQRTPCLCGIGPNECRDILNDNGSVTVVGSCLDRRGACTAACSGVLAFPAEPAAP